ncbi:IS110 family transposase [Candidatus Chlorohelix allophototropha]|uniref:IS110 family transposase n=3 Tax=Candidatus Chlorohelix allophototropha TaxID=3003348 RepID=A0ABY9B338_9CHLR|nr:IS110 family transposase [Chloroflexota bacterium L227-S17]
MAPAKDLPVPKSRPKYEYYAGLDIAAKTFTAATCYRDAEPSRAVSLSQSPEGYASLTKFLLKAGHPLDQILVVMEATGTYWIELATYLQGEGFAVSVINPKQAHDFAGALGLKPKNDQLDAQLLARLSATLQPARWTPPPQIYRELYQRLTHRLSLLEARQQFRNQLHALSVARPVEGVVTSLENLIATLTERIKQVDKEIKELLKLDQEWAASVTLLQTITGIGRLTAVWLVVVTLNFTSCSSAEGLTHFTGLAPIERSSGTSVRNRPMIGKGGHSRLRALLYMAAGSAMRFNPVIKAYCERMQKTKGRAYKEVRCAAARKLIHLGFAVVKSGQPFDPAYQPSSQKKAGASLEAKAS